jgi:hypothetical protein
LIGGKAGEERRVLVPRLLMIVLVALPLVVELERDYLNVFDLADSGLRHGGLWLLFVHTGRGN